MTLNELKREVIKLGFELDIEDLEGLTICANRAIRIMLAERRITSTVFLNTEDYSYEDDAPYYEIDFRDEFPDFLSFVNQIKDVRGNIVTGIVANDGILQIPMGYKGMIIVTYQRLPTPVLSSDPDLQIDIPRELEHMLPLLVASFLWLDDDEAKAQYYLAIYRDLMNTVRRYGNRCIDTTYYGNGWA